MATSNMLGGVASTRTYHHGNLRATLLEHAEAALAAGGELSLRELARQAGVSHGGAATALRGQAGAARRARAGRLRAARCGARGRAGRQPRPGFRGSLLAFGRTYVHFATEHAALLELMFAGKHRPDIGEGVARAADEAFAASFSLFRAAQAAGEIVPGDPERLGTVAFAALPRPGGHRQRRHARPGRRPRRHGRRARRPAGAGPSAALVPRAACASAKRPPAHGASRCHRRRPLGRTRYGS